MIFLRVYREEIEIIKKGLFLGAAASIPLFIFIKRGLDERLENGTVVYPMPGKKKQRKYFWLFIILSILYTKYPELDLLNFFLKGGWPLIALTFAWLISSILELLYILRLEKDLGTPLTRRMKDDS